MTFNEIEQDIVWYEREYFIGGAFSESTIKTDLENRKAMDRLSTMGSLGRQTNELANKREFYIKEFNDSLNWISSTLDAARIHRAWDTTFISRCEKCKEQANRLLNFVRNFY